MAAVESTGVRTAACAAAGRHSSRDPAMAGAASRASVFLAGRIIFAVLVFAVRIAADMKSSLE
jgi:hypothetical protein